MKVTGTDGKEYTIEPRADLRWAYLIRADLTDVCLSKANLTGADLTGADLSKANLSEADLSKVNLIRAIWNDETVFPEGFEIPEKSGT